MDDRARSAYRGMAYGFLGIGAAFVLVAVLERVIGFEFFNGSPVRVALLLIAIGGSLLWTVRRSPGEDDSEASAAAGRSEGVGSDGASGGSDPPDGSGGEG